MLPFNGETPQEVFENILSKSEHFFSLCLFRVIAELKYFLFWHLAALDWPEPDEMSDNMRQTIDSLLTLNPEERSNGYDLRKQQLFQNIQWDHLLSVEPPFVPQPDSEYDTSYFRGKLLKCLITEVKSPFGMVLVSEHERM